MGGAGERHGGGRNRELGHGRYLGVLTNLLYPAPAGNSPDPESLIQAQKPLLAS
jgi:hypothetical protein